MIVEGPRTLATEGKGLLLSFLFALIIIQATYPVCKLRIIVLISIAPLAGAMLMDRATSGRFKSWLDKLIELFFEQINLVIVFVVAAAIVKPFQDRSLGDAFVMTTLSIITLLMALMEPSMMVWPPEPGVWAISSP